MLVPGVRDDVDPLDDAAAAHRPGDDDLPEVLPADQLHAAHGREHVAAVHAEDADHAVLVGYLRRVDGRTRNDAVQALDDDESAARDGHAGNVAPRGRDGISGGA